MKNIKDVVTVINSDGVILFQSRSATEMFGYELDEMLGRNVLDLVHPDDVERSLATLAKTVNQEDDDPFFRCRFKHKDGSWRWVEVIGDVIDDIAGNDIILSARDVTETQNTLSHLQQSEELLDAAFHATSTIFSITRPGTGEFLAVNQAWMDVSGWTREEALGRTSNELNIWGSPENRQKMIDAMGDDGQVSGLRMNIRTKQGADRTILMDARMLQLQEGERMLLSAIDVSEQEELEKQLLHAQKMEALGQLTGGIAHDFNNLLSVIVGHAEMLEHMSPDASQSESITAIQKAASSGAELVQSLLAFSRKQHLRPESFSLSERIAGIRPLLQTTLTRNVALTTEFYASPDNCRLDAAKFDSALLNLVINAQQAMEESGAISITTRNRVVRADEPIQIEPGNYLELVVTDTGTGMSEAALEKAFDPFFTTRQTSGGSGLGLSMVFGFVTQSGGDVSIRSAPEEGTTVTLLLPCGESS